MSKFKKVHIVELESDSFRVECNIDFANDNYGITVFDSYSGKSKPYLHLADDTAKELVELLQAALQQFDKKEYKQ